MSRQVSTLLYEVEKLRTKVFNNKKSASSTFIEADADSTSQQQSMFLNTMFNDTINEQEVTSSSDFITKHMIEFRHVEELQKQNQKLIRYAREITEHKESEEKAELELKTKEYNEKLDMAFKQMEEFKSQREKQEQMFDEICKQRDTYKQLLAQKEEEQHEKSITMMENDSFSYSKLAEKSTADTQNALERLQQKFERYQHETMETNRILNEEIENYRKNLSELNTKYALSESKLEGTVEKCKTLNATVEKYKKECETLKERNSKFSELIVKHEQSLNAANLELHKAKERQCELETNLRSLTIERDLFKSNQERLSVENHILTRENQSRTLILQNLESIRSSCERNERENKIMYHDKIDGLEKENTIMRKRLETDEEQRKLIQKSFETQVKELNSRLESEMKERENSRDQLVKVGESYEATKNKLIEVEAKLHSSEQLIQMTRNSKSSTTISRLTELEEQTKDLNLKLSLSEKEIVNLKIQLEDSKTHAKQYSTIADNMEKTLRESSETFEKTKKILEERINQLQSEKACLENEYNSLQTQKCCLENELRNEKDINENRIKTLNNDYTNAMKELSNTREKLNQTEMVLNERTRDRDEYVAQIRILEEQSGVESGKMNEYKMEIDSLSERLRAQTEAYSRLEKDNLLNSRLYSETLEELNNNEAIHKEKCENFENENKQLVKQINVLQDELNRLSESVQILQKDTLSTSFKMFDEKITVEEADYEQESSRRRESMSNLYEINRFLREQKDQLDKKYQNLSLEHEITMQRLKNVEFEFSLNKDKVQSYENEIESLRIRNSFNTSANADDYDLIVDTNKRLKEQYDSVTVQLNEVNEKLKRLEDEIYQIKTEKCALEIESETLLGEKTGMQLEIKRWKDRVDSLLRNSDIGDEWIKAQKEVSDLQEQTQTLTDMINDLRKNLTSSNNDKEMLLKDYEGYKVATQEEKAKILAELETVKQERAKKEDIFKILVTELKDAVITVQKELDVKDYEWVSKLKNIKEELSLVKKAIVDRIRADKEQIRVKTSSLVEADKQISQLNELNRKSSEEKEKRIKELEDKNRLLQERIDKAMKAVESSQSKILKQRQRIEELTGLNNEMQLKYDSCQNEINEIKTQKPVVNTTTTTTTMSVQQQQAAATTTTTTASSTPNTKILATSNTVIVQSATSSSISSGSSPTATTSTSSVLNIESTQTAPPTAYIAPSRINKITPLNSRALTGFGDASKRTAAVQPTPHESGNKN
jgi:nucleoprotein TPR